MKKKPGFSIVISFMLVLALLLSGCEELRSIFTPTPTTDTTIEPPELSPARDLTGTWVSSLRGHGIDYTTASKVQPYGWTDRGGCRVVSPV